MAKLKDLKSTAKEMVEVMGLQDEVTKVPIEVDDSFTEEDLLKIIKEAIPEIRRSDKFSDVAEKVIDEVRNGLEKEEEPEEVEPEVTEPEEVDELDDLEDQITAGEKLSDLKEICKVSDHFKTLRGLLSKYRTVDDLRKDMIEVLDKVRDFQEGKEDEPKPKPKASPVKEAVKDIKSKEAPVKKVKEKKEKGPKKPGIIDTIVSLIEESGKNGISKDEILEALVDTFPKNARDSMKRTVNVQVPYRINKERFTLEKMENGNFRKKAK